MRRLFVAAVAAALAVVVSGCGAPQLTSDAAKYYTSDTRRNLVNQPYNNLANTLFTALREGKLGTAKTYTGNIPSGAPSKCPPSGASEVSAPPSGRVQICSGDGRFAITGLMTAGQMDPTGFETGIRLPGIEAWKDNNGVVSGYTPSGDTDDIQAADGRLVAAFKESSKKYFGI